MKFRKTSRQRSSPWRASSLATDRRTPALDRVGIGPRPGWSGRASTIDDGPAEVDRRQGAARTFGRRRNPEAEALVGSTRSGPAQAGGPAMPGHGRTRRVQHRQQAGWTGPGLVFAGNALIAPGRSRHQRGQGTRPGGRGSTCSTTGKRLPATTAAAGSRCSDIRPTGQPAQLGERVVEQPDRLGEVPCAATARGPSGPACTDGGSGDGSDIRAQSRSAGRGATSFGAIR